MDTTKSSAPARSPEHPETLAGDPIAYAARIKAQEELLQAAENAVAWLESRRRHYPPEMRDAPEGVHRKALKEAIRAIRGSEAPATLRGER